MSLLQDVIIEDNLISSNQNYQCSDVRWRWERWKKHRELWEEFSSERMPSLLEGIESKYGVDVSSSSPPGSPSPSIGSDDSGADLLFVPRRKRLPQVLVFNDFGIDSAGSPEHLQLKCKHVQELDLAQNALSQWNEVLTILYHMPSLQFANLSFNSLSGGLQAVNKESFPNLKNLILNSTHIDWPSVRKLVSALPSLEELHLSLNGYSDVQLDEKDFPVVHNGVKQLYFTGNPINDWSEVTKLGRSFPKLETLVLARCPISNLACRDRDGKTDVNDTSPASPHAHAHLPNLTLLNLNNTLISSWSDVERLAEFPKLAHLRLHGLPLLEKCDETAHERRQLMIARLPNIVTLNGGGEISLDDREDAERAFIRHFMDRPESERPARYNELVSIHGRLDPLINVDLSPERSVSVTLQCGNRTEVRKLDVYQTVSELKQRLEDFAQFPATKMRLFYVDQVMKGIHGPELMKFPNKQIYSYNISSGDEIIIDSK